MIDKPNVNLTVEPKKSSVLAEHKALIVARYPTNIYLKNPLSSQLESSHLKNLYLKFKEINKDTYLSVLGIAEDPDSVNSLGKIKVLKDFAENEELIISILEEEIKINIEAPKTSLEVANLVKEKLELSNNIDILNVEEPSVPNLLQGEFKATNIVDVLQPNMFVSLEVSTGELTLAKKTNNTIELVGLVLSVDTVRKTATVVYQTSGLAGQKVRLGEGYVPVANDVLTIKDGLAVAPSDTEGLAIAGVTLVEESSGEPAFWNLAIAQDVTNITTVIYGDVNWTDRYPTLMIISSLKGSLGNSIYFASNSKNLEIEAFSGGVSNDEVDFSVLGEDRYQTIVYSREFDIDILDEFLLSRQNVENKLLEGVGVYSTVNEFVLDEYNNPFLCKLSIKAPISHPDIFSVSFGAVRSKRLTENTSIADLVDVSVGSRNQVGGINLSPVPYHNTDLTKYVKIADTYSSQELLDLENLRYTVIDYNISKTNVLIGEAFTLYRFNSFGEEDLTYQFLNIVDVAISSKEYFFNNLKADNRQIILTTKNAKSKFGQKSRDEIANDINKYWFSLVTDYGILRDEKEEFKASLVVDLVPLTGTINCTYEILPVVGLRAINGAISVKI